MNRVIVNKDSEKLYVDGELFYEQKLPTVHQGQPHGFAVTELYYGERAMWTNREGLYPDEGRTVEEVEGVSN